MLDARSMLGFECSVCSMLEYLLLGNARARKCSQIGARTRSMLGKLMLDPTLINFCPRACMYYIKNSSI